MPAIEPPSPRTLVDDLLQEQQQLSAAARFSQWHESHEEPAQVRQYRGLIPLTFPRPGQQFAFEVDLDKCTGCKACVSACHSLNGLDDGEAWRDVGLLVNDDWRHPFQQTVTTACHHCVDPACLNGCPVLAYDKDPVTGVVRHLDDQCIGCQYCVLKCPYEVPKYSNRRGIVRKCDMCSSRLAVGEAPACVQACPNEAIRITMVETQPLVLQLRATTTSSPVFLPAAPAPDYTLPTTRYKSVKPLPVTLRAADHEELRPESPHLPLVFMLVLSQLSVGLFGFAALMSTVLPTVAAAGTLRAQTLFAFMAGVIAVASSVLHLGRPLGAWRCFLGLRKSWLSREIVAFGIFLPLAAAYTGEILFPARVGPVIALVTGLAAVLAGLLGVFCSAMVYHDTRREFWRLSFTGSKFFGTTLLQGSAGTLLVALMTISFPSIKFVLSLIAILFVSALYKLAVEHRVLRHLADDNFSPLHKTALLLSGRFGLVYRWRVACAVLGALVLPPLLALQLLTDAPAVVLRTLAATIFVLCFGGELLERWLFFTTVQPVKMPGAIAS